MCPELLLRRRGDLVLAASVSKRASSARQHAAGMDLLRISSRQQPGRLMERRPLASAGMVLIFRKSRPDGMP